MGEELTRFPQSDQRINSGVGGNYGSDDTGTTDSTIIESTNTEWTDEKHSLYLNSIEESFVNQLFSHDYCANNSHGWLSRNQQDKEQQSGLHSVQFKVQRRGCWEEIKYERVRNQTEIVNESHSLAANPWIKHFRSPKPGCRRRERASFEATSSSKQLSHSGDVYHLESIGSSTEVSDQNFADDEWEVETKISRTCRKRSKNAVADASLKDQVVPYKNSSTTPSKETCSPVSRIDAASGRQVHKT